MPNYYKKAQEYWKKKYGKVPTLPESGGMPQPKDSVIPSIKLNSIIRQRSFSDRTGFSKYLFEFDIATRAIAIAAIFIFIGGYFIVPTIYQGVFAYFHYPENSSASTMSQIGQSVTKKVYANSAPLNADKIFSVQPNNITLAIPGAPKRTVYGFMPYWMLEKESQINFNELTTISLFGLDVDGGGNIATGTGDGQPDPGWQMWNDPNLTDVLTKVRKNKTTIELTFKCFNNTDIERLVTSDDAQKKFIANAIYLLQSKSLDGVNLDFEYTGTPDQKITDGFTRLVTNLRSELDRQMPGSTLTVDTYVSAASVRGLFDIERLSEKANSLIIMGYDIHTPTGDPGPLAPLEGQTSILGYMQSYLEKVPSDKLILAVAYYGYDWNAKNNQDTDMLSYAEIVDLSKDKTIQWDENAKSPYFMYKDPTTRQNRVVHFENVRSLSAKYDLINEKNLKGVGIWALGYDGLNTDLENLLVEKFAQ